ncbi:MAG TPA: 1-acyl-sn-glycerol-3-phosphate acyltransferase [Candidatus Angelobacter sp.]|nr:1-acyl-sn-glycerol-3-phosphate acyltransferase [Candidatus Angelobacter sp.]
MARITLIAGAANPLAGALLDSLRQATQGHVFTLADPSRLEEHVNGSTACVYVPACRGRDAMKPDLREAEDVFRSAERLACPRFVVLSSALVYGNAPGRQVLVDESYTAPGESGRIAEQWRCLESQAVKHFPAASLVILRPSLLMESPALPARRLRKRFVSVLPGHDPSLQILSLFDLAQVMLLVIDNKMAGAYNVAPDRVVPIKRAISHARGWCLPIPRTLQRLAGDSESLDSIRYPWTISNAKIKRDLGFVPRRSSLAALRDFRGRGKEIPDPEPAFDDFGLDLDYIRFRSRTIFRFLSDLYWRIEHQGMEYIPRSGPAILVGMHRGFVPLDGAMAVHTILCATGRVPRFLTHPMLYKFPFLFDFMSKMGGVPACRESAVRILENNELLGVFPEGVKGAFSLYRNAYRLQGFGRDAFVKLALRYRAPIIPFVTVGSAEIFPVFAAIPFPWFKRYAGFPYIPITPTFPLLPLPLPSKWHTQFLSPIDTARYPADAADDPSVIKAISVEVRTRMQCAVDDMRRRRESIFFGSIFKTPVDKTTKSAAV